MNPTQIAQLISIIEAILTALGQSGITLPTLDKAMTDLVSLKSELIDDTAV
jgi:hypothetical protein